MAEPKQKFSVAACLAWESAQSDRHELWSGEVFAMVGAARAHGRVVANLMRHLGNHLAGSPSQAFSKAMKVQAGDDLFYPDVFITCDHEVRAEQLIFAEPILVIEVLSPSTEAFDRGKKWASYRRLQSLREYVLIDPHARTVETYRRDEHGAWDFADVSGLSALELTCADCRVSITDLFDGIGS